MDDKAADFWARVNSELKKQKKTQVELCEKQGLLINSLRVRISHHAAPNIFDAQKIAEFLNVPLEYLITGESPATIENDLINELKNRILRIKTICNEGN